MKQVGKFTADVNDGAIDFDTSFVVQRHPLDEDLSESFDDKGSDNIRRKVFFVSLKKELEGRNEVFEKFRECIKDKNPRDINVEIKNDSNVQFIMGHYDGKKKVIGIEIDNLVIRVLGNNIEFFNKIGNENKKEDYKKFSPSKEDVAKLAALYGVQELYQSKFPATIDKEDEVLEVKTPSGLGDVNLAIRKTKEVSWGSLDLPSEQYLKSDSSFVETEKETSFNVAPTADIKYAPQTANSESNFRVTQEERKEVKDFEIVARSSESSRVHNEYETKKSESINRSDTIDKRFGGIEPEDKFPSRRFDGKTTGVGLGIKGHQQVASTPILDSKRVSPLRTPQSNTPYRSEAYAVAREASSNIRKPGISSKATVQGKDRVEKSNMGYTSPLREKVNQTQAPGSIGQDKTSSSRSPLPVRKGLDNSLRITPKKTDSTSPIPSRPLIKKEGGAGIGDSRIKAGLGRSAPQTRPNLETQGSIKNENPFAPISGVAEQGKTTQKVTNSNVENLNAVAQTRVARVLDRTPERKEESNPFAGIFKDRKDQEKSKSVLGNVEAINQRSSSANVEFGSDRLPKTGQEVVGKAVNPFSSFLQESSEKRANTSVRAEEEIIELGFDDSSEEISREQRSENDSREIGSAQDQRVSGEEEIELSFYDSDEEHASRPTNPSDISPDKFEIGVDQESNISQGTYTPSVEAPNTPLSRRSSYISVKPDQGWSVSRDNGGNEKVNERILGSATSTKMSVDGFSGVVSQSNEEEIELSFYDSDVDYASRASTPFDISQEKSSIASDQKSNISQDTYTPSTPLSRRSSYISGKPITPTIDGGWSVSRDNGANEEVQAKILSGVASATTPAVGSEYSSPKVTVRSPINNLNFSDLSVEEVKEEKSVEPVVTSTESSKKDVEAELSFPTRNVVTPRKTVSDIAQRFGGSVSRRVVQVDNELPRRASEQSRITIGAEMRGLPVMQNILGLGDARFTQRNKKRPSSLFSPGELGDLLDEISPKYEVDTISDLESGGYRKRVKNNPFGFWNEVKDAIREDMDVRKKQGKEVKPDEDEFYFYIHNRDCNDKKGPQLDRWVTNTFLTIMANVTLEFYTKYRSTHLQGSDIENLIEKAANQGGVSTFSVMDVENKKIGGVPNPDAKSFEIVFSSKFQKYCYDYGFYRDKECTDKFRLTSLSKDIFEICKEQNIFDRDNYLTPDNEIKEDVVKNIKDKMNTVSLSPLGEVRRNSISPIKPRDGFSSRSAESLSHSSSVYKGPQHG